MTTQPRPTIYEQPRAIDVWAQMLARRQVRMDIRRKGYKLNQFTVSDIAFFAERSRAQRAIRRGQGNLRRVASARIAQARAATAAPIGC